MAFRVLFREIIQPAGGGDNERQNATQISQTIHWLGSGRHCATCAADVSRSVFPSARRQRPHSGGVDRMWAVWGAADLRDFLEGEECGVCGALRCGRVTNRKTTREILEPASAAVPSLKTSDFRKVLDMKELEAVIVATPDHWHALPTVMACQAGKDVYVEKPLSVSIGEGRVMVDVARKHDRVVQMGTQQRSAPHYTEAVDYVKSGKLGRVRLVRAWAYLDWKGETPVQPDGAGTGGRGLRHVARTRPKTAFQSESFSLHLPLVLGLFRWLDDRLGRAHDRYRELGHGYKGAQLGGFDWRQVWISQRRHGNPGYAAGDVGFPGLQYDLGACTGRWTRTGRPRTWCPVPRRARGPGCRS